MYMIAAVAFKNVGTANVSKDSRMRLSMYGSFLVYLVGFICKCTYNLTHLRDVPLLKFTRCQTSTSVMHTSTAVLDQSQS